MTFGLWTALINAIVGTLNELTTLLRFIRIKEQERN